MIERIDLIDQPPEPGRQYLVPTVYYWGFTPVGAIPTGQRGHWPVLGRRHTDRAHLNFEPLHYHVDIRFITPEQEQRMLAYHNTWYSPGQVPEAQRLGELAARAPLNNGGFDGLFEPPPASVEYRPMRCRRADNHYPTGKIIKQARNRLANSKFLRFWSAYAGRDCPRHESGQLLCPHRRFPLGSIAPDRRGVVTCPLHGLPIDPKSGKVLDWQAAYPEEPAEEPAGWSGSSEPLQEVE